VRFIILIFLKNDTDYESIEVWR